VEADALIDVGYQTVDNDPSLDKAWQRKGTVWVKIMQRKREPRMGTGRFLDIEHATNSVVLGLGVGNKAVGLFTMHTLILNTDERQAIGSEMGYGENPGHKETKIILTVCENE